MGIFAKKNDAAVIMAEHGRWVARLRGDVQILDQRLRSLESRVSAAESNLSDLAKDYGRLDIALSKLEAERGPARGCGK